MSETRLCIVCGRTELEPTERQTCVKCLARTRSAVGEIVELYALLPAELTDHAGAARPPDAVGQADSDGVPDALVLLASGSVGSVTASRAGDRSHAADHWPADAPSVVAVLASWEDDWRGLAVAQQEATVTSCAGYLTEHLGWAAQNHPAFDEFARDMRQLRDQLRRVAREGEATDRGVPCPYCGSRLIRRFDDADGCDHGERPRFQIWYSLGYDLDIWQLEHQRWEARHAYCDQGGRREDWVCSDRECGRVFDDKHYNFAVWVQHYERKRAG